MAVLSTEEIIEVVREHQKTPKYIRKAREYKKSLEALIKGKDYTELLEHIDKYESTSKAKARQKYTFSIKDMFERLFTNIENVWTATGGVKLYYPEDSNLESEKRKKLIEMCSHVRGGTSLERWNESVWMQTYHTDPAGITILEYNIEKGYDPYPEYVSIDEILGYKANGINLEYILFEPIIIDEDTNTKKYRFIDDSKDYTIFQKGENIYIDELESFDNPFGQVPCLINSDLIDVDGKKRLSPIDPIIELCKEYLRDKSIKTIYKFLQGFPLFWRQVTDCIECNGTGKDGTGKTCGVCGGTGYAGRRDITDTVNIKAPEDGGDLGEIAGFIVPPTEILGEFNSELELLERACRMTMWGAIIEDDQSETATGRRIDAQPILQKLNKYTTPAETREQKLTEWIANFADPMKDKNEKVSSIVYGRNYALLSADTVLEIYENAKENGDSVTILDRLFNQYLLSEYKNDPISLHTAFMKAQIEPYMHYTIEQVKEVFGADESAKKMLFDKWWRATNTIGKDAEQLEKEFNNWLIEYEKQKVDRGVRFTQSNEGQSEE